MRALPTLLFTATFAAASPVGAETYSVNTQGTGDYPNLSQALLEAISGDTILLGEGTFGPSATGEVLPLDIPPGVSVVGQGSTETFLDGEYGEEIAMIRWAEDDEVRVEELCFIHGESPRDGDPDALYIWQSKVALWDVVFKDNGDPSIPDMPWNLDIWIDVRSSEVTFVGGGLQGNWANNRGVTCTDSVMVFENVGFASNRSYYGILDLREGCSGSMDRIHLDENFASNCDGALVATGAITASNVESVGNDVGPCRLWQGVELVHATMAGNDSQGFFPLVEVDRLGHSIVAFNGGAVALTGEQRAVFNDVYGNEPVDWEGPDPTGGDGNVSVDPRFVVAPDQPAEPDLRLDVDSPLIDAGGDELTSAADIWGDPRPVDGDGSGVAAPDPGAYEAPEDYYEPGDDDDSAGDDDGDDDDGCECAVGPGVDPGAAAIPALLLGALALVRRRG